MKILCVFGKHQYGTPSLGVGIEYSSFIPALKNIGHEVIHFESRDRSSFSNFADLNQAILKTVEHESPDVMLVVQRNYEIWLETLNIIRENTNTATICWTTDDSWKYREVSRFIGKSYHAMTTTYPEILPKYHEDGISNVLLTQWAANSATIREPLHAGNCRYQVSFVGAAHGNRKIRIKELLKNGIDVTCFGNGWENGPVDVEDIPEIMRNSVISLNFANSKGQNQIKARNFEVPGAGGFLLTEAAPGLDAFYISGKEIEIFHNTKDLIEKIKYYLTNPEKRDSIAWAGNERTRQEHTYEMRMRKVLDFAISAKDSWLSSKDNLIPEFEQAVHAHRNTFFLKALRIILLFPSIILWGKNRGPRAARRLTFELSWRFYGKRTFSASGLPGRMFPEQ